MNQPPICRCLIGLALLMFLAACEKTDTKGTVVARYEGGILTTEDLSAHRDIMASQRKFYDNPGLLTDDLVFEHAVNMEMIIAKGLKENLHLDPRIRAKLHSQMADLFLKLLQHRLVAEIDRNSLTEEMVRAYYQAHISSYTTPARYGLCVISHSDPVFLKDLKEQIENQEVSFKEAARAHSLDGETRDQGGDAGSRPLASYQPEWRPVIDALVVNDISDPFLHNGTYYLIQLTHKTEPVVQSFDERREYIRNDLLYAKYRDAWKACYDSLKKEFNLTVDEKQLHRFIGHGEEHGQGGA